MKHTFIYALVDPRDSRIRYIGKSNNPEKRLKEHMGQAKKVKGEKWICPGRAYSQKLIWLDSLIMANEYPLLIILEKCNYKNWREAEDRWVIELVGAGAKLVNTKTKAGHPNLYADRFFIKRF